MLNSSPAARFIHLALRAGIGAICCVFTAWAGSGQVRVEAKKVSFNIPVSEAPAALKKFSAQSGQQVLYANDDLAGITTNAVKGEFTHSDALTRLLAGTPLVATHHPQSGAFAVGREGSGPKGQRAALNSGDRPMIPQTFRNLMHRPTP
jgi:hypothetical protein